MPTSEVAHSRVLASASFCEYLEGREMVHVLDGVVFECRFRDVCASCIREFVWGERRAPRRRRCERSPSDSAGEGPEHVS